MTFKLLDPVVAAQDIPEQGVTAGMVGTIVEVFDGAFEVEFCDDNGVTLAMFAMQPSQLTPYVEMKKAA